MAAVGAVRQSTAFAARRPAVFPGPESTCCAPQESIRSRPNPKNRKDCAHFRGVPQGASESERMDFDDLYARSHAPAKSVAAWRDYYNPGDSSTF